jgi:hypothetical protein
MQGFNRLFQPRSPMGIHYQFSSASSDTLS